MRRVSGLFGFRRNSTREPAPDDGPSGQGAPLVQNPIQVPTKTQPQMQSRYLAFLSHKQKDTGDRAHTIYAELLDKYGFATWMDRWQEVTQETMQAGVSESAVFVLFASKDYASFQKSTSCLLEVITALKLNKPIVLILDQIPSYEWCITPDLVEGWVNSLFEEAKQHSVWTSDIVAMGLDSFKARIQANERVYINKPGSPPRLSLLRDIVEIGGCHVPPVMLKPTIEKEDPSKADILLVGDATKGADQCYLITLGLETVGIRAAVLDPSDNIETILHESPTVRGVVVYLSSAIFEGDLGKRAIKAAKFANKKILGVFEADGRREDVWNLGKLRAQADNDADILEFLDRDQQHFAQFDRKGDYFLAWVKKGIAHRLGLDLLFTDISVDSSFRVARAAAEKLESGTREWLMDMLLNHDHPCAVLAADAGMGKSCVMGTLAMRRYSVLAKQFGGLVESSDGDVGAVHFFQYLDDTDRQATNCVLSLAKQLCVSLPGFRACLPDAEGSTQKWIQAVRKRAAEMKGNSEEQIRHLLNELIIKPCSMLKDHPNRLLLLIDALDECPDADSFSAAVEYLWLDDANRAKSCAPPWLQLMISTRRDSNTVVRFDGFDPIILEQRPEATSKEMVAKNTQDLKKVIASRIYKGDACDDGVLNVILDKSEGIFLWLAYQQHELREMQSKGQLTLDAVNSLPQGLRRVYVDFFKRVRDQFSELEKEHMEVGQLYDRTLGVGVIAPRAPIPMDTWRSVLGFTATDMSSKLLALKVESILSRLLIFDSSTNTIRAPHKSMVDFLHYDEKETDRAILNLQIESLKYHVILGMGLLKHLDKLESSRTVMEMGHYTHEDAYALRHVVYHLTQGNLLDLAKWQYLDLKRLIRLVDQAREESYVLRVILEGRTLLSVLQAQRVTTDLPKARLSISILQLAQEAIAIDARMLPGQMLGRLGMPPYNTERIFFENQVESWRAEVKRERGIVAMPRHPWLSGLSPAGTALENVVNFDQTVNAVALRGTKEVFVAVKNVVERLDLETGRKLQIFEGHSDEVTSIVISFDSKWLVSGSEDKTARVWNLASGEQVKLLEEHSGLVTSVAISSDSKLVMTGSADGTARIWSLISGEQVMLLKGHYREVTSVAISHDSMWVLTGSFDKTARVWNLASGQQVKVLEGHSQWVTSLAISPDSKWVVTGSGDKSARVWNLASGEQVKVFEGHLERLTSLAISPDSKWVVTGSRDRTARVWDLATGDQVKVLEGHSDWVTSVAISSDSMWAVTGSRGRTARIWNLANEGQVNVLKGHFREVTSVAISSDAMWAVTGSFDTTARIWNLASGEPTKVLKGHANRVNSVAISSDSTWVVTGSYDTTARIWNLESGEHLKALEGHTDWVTSVTISPDSKWVVTSSGDKTVRVWSIASGEQVKRLGEHSEMVTSLTISSDSQWVMTISWIGVVHIWNLASGEHVMGRTPDSLKIPPSQAVRDRHVASSMPNSVGTFLDFGLIQVQRVGNTVFGATSNNAIFCWSLV